MQDTDVILDVSNICFKLGHAAFTRQQLKLAVRALDLYSPETAGPCGLCYYLDRFSDLNAAHDGEAFDGYDLVTALYFKYKSVKNFWPVKFGIRTTEYVSDNNGYNPHRRALADVMELRMRELLSA